MKVDTDRTTTNPPPLETKVGAAGIPTLELAKRIDAAPDGLSQEEAESRRVRYGYNELAEEKVSALRKLLSYLWGPIPWMIEVAAILSAVVRHWADLVIILVLLAMNAAVGFWEEYQAGNAVAALKKKLALRAKVKRNGQWTALPARELVPGDLIRLRLGDIVPADARLLDGEPVEVDQSALTGESLPVTHGQGDDVYSSSIIRRGETDALVFATGQDTYFGKTTHLVESTRVVSHFQRAVLRIGNYLIVLAAAMVALILTVALLRGDNMITTIQFALILTVAAIPVAMPTVLSVTMAVGARLLAKKEAIVTRLAAVEEMAGIDVLCSDKTGTLTQNKLTMGEPFVVEASGPQQVVLNAALASRAEDQDTIDLAVLSGLKDIRQLEQYQLLHYLPFDPVHKHTEATVKDPDGHIFKASKGAPQVILAMAVNRHEIESKVEEAVNAFAARGFRSLGVTRADENAQWRFLGVIPLYDPPREDSKATVETAQQMGCDVKMVTGDQVAIAREIGHQLGMGANILDASIFKEIDHRDSARVADVVEKADGFAQVLPEDKYDIIEALQRHGHIVGMTGDGVNDAPPLKRADAGIAVSGATDAARAAADIVLLTPGLSVIIEAIKESRKIFQRMTSYATYRIAETIRVLLFLTVSIVIFNFYPVTAIMIVLLAVLNDGAILSIAYDRVHYSNRPESWDMPMVLGIATALGVAGVAESFALLYLAKRVFLIDPAVIPSLIYLKLSVAGHLTIFVTRTRHAFWSTKPSWILLSAVTGTQLLATLITVYGLFMAPLGWGWALVVWGYALFFFLIEDRVKLLAYSVFDHRRKGRQADEASISVSPHKA